MGNETPERSGDPADLKPFPAHKDHWTPEGLLHQEGEFRSSSGPLLLMCVLHELNPNGIKTEAITVVAGLAVCRKHLVGVANAIFDGPQYDTRWFLNAARFNNI